MDKNIGVGFLVALAVFCTIAFNNSKSFNKSQKVILTILIVFLPAQLILALLFYLYNTQHRELSQKIDVKLNGNNYHYHIVEGGKQSEPLTFDQLKEKRITEDTMIWRKGLENWVKAKDLYEIKNIIYIAPPPIPTINNTEQPSEKIQAEDKYIIDGMPYTLSEIEENLKHGKYIVTKITPIEVVQNDDFQNIITVSMKDYEPLKPLLKYFPPDIKS